MKVLIAGSIQGDSGYEEKMLVLALVDELKRLNIEVDYFFLPYVRDVLSLPDEIVRMQLIDTSMSDILITVGYPACFIPHRNKKIFLFQTVPMLFEYWDSEYGVIPDNRYIKIKDIVFNIEKKTFEENKVYCASNILSEDLEYRYKINSKVYYLPDLLKSSSKAKINITEETFVTETDLYPEDRIEDEIIPLFKSLNKNLIIFIPRSSKMYENSLYEAIKEYDLEDRVKVVNGYLDVETINQSKAYIYGGYGRRKIPFGIIRALENNMQVIGLQSEVMDEISKQYDDVLVVEKIDEVKDVILRNNIRLKQVSKDKQDKKILNKLVKEMVGL